MTHIAILFVVGIAAASGTAQPLQSQPAEITQRVSTDGQMYGLIGKMKAVPGQRDALIDILLQSTGSMPGCLSYIVARDQTDPDAIWITEVWGSRESHQASLKLPAVQAAIAKARPLIAGFGERFETTPVGGYGLSGAK
jgi:quinol monooxygenase YgiN